MEGEVLSGLCRECFGQKNALINVPDHFNLMLCPQCGSWMKGKNWSGWSSLEDFLSLVFKEESVISRSVASHTFEVTSQEEDNRQIVAEVLFHLDVPPFCYEMPAKIKIIKRFHSCDVCSKISGTYYEAILQIRPTGKALSDDKKADIIARTEDAVASSAKKDRSSFVSKMGSVHGGLDFYMSPASLAKSISRDISARHGAQITISTQLMGRKDGKDIYRTTFLVRMPEYGTGDFLYLDGTVYMVTGFSGKHASLLKLLDWATVKKEPGKVLAGAVFGGPEARKEAVVLSETTDEIQILDPDALTPVSLIKPGGFLGGRETVTVVTYEDETFICPD